MKTIFAILFGLTFCLLGTMTSKADDYKVADIYSGLRQNVVSLTEKQLGLKGTNKNQVLAVLMETGYPEAVATLVAVSDGSASIYFSNGGGIIGAGEYAEVKKESLSFITVAGKYLSLMKKTSNYDLPRKGFTRFYVVTNGGVLTTEVLEDDLGNNKSNFSPAFYQGQKLITAIREADKRRSAEQ